jgi:electron-transferring-flavoprotein dehydrogenase
MSSVERPSMDVDIVCVGFGPAAGGFLTTIADALAKPEDAAVFESRVSPGLPLQVICYERADDIGFGVSGVVTRARGIRASFPSFNPSDIPMAAPVSSEKVYYLLDPQGASRRPLAMRMADKVLRGTGLTRNHAYELPYVPPFLNKHDGFVLSIGQFNQWVGQQLMMSGTVQIWPSSPVSEPLMDNHAVAGIRLADQGDGEGFQPGMDVRAALTVVADGPVGPVGRDIDERLGVPPGFEKDEWAVGMKFVVDLPESCHLPTGTVIHTIGFPEPEIFGFLYVHPDRMASVGIFVPSWFDNPVRTSYRYLQHYIQHPTLWQHLKGGRLRSWGAKSLQESGRRSEPYLAGDGYARIGENSGSTNVLTGSGVDEAWTTGAQLGEAVIELWRSGRPFTKENLEATYVKRRRESWVDQESKIAAKARDGFSRGVVQGLIGMAVAGVTGGRAVVGRKRPKPLPSNVERLTVDEYMDRAGWPKIEFDGQLLVTQQDALLVGGKVQAPGGYADHVVFLDPQRCETCGAQTCISICSGQAIHTAEAEGVPAFDREKCIHCGACLWNCAEKNVAFRAGAGGLHSAEN